MFIYVENTDEPLFTMYKGWKIYNFNCYALDLLKVERTSNLPQRWSFINDDMLST